MHPKNISITDYIYSLPESKIAEYPLAERDASRLLIYNKGNISEDIYKNISSQLPPGSLLVFNDTKVVEARLLFQKPTGGIIEIFCLEPASQYPDISTAMTTQGKVYWHCLVGGASKWKKGQVLEKNINQQLILRATYTEKASGYFIIELSWAPATLSFAEVLHLAGAVPLPPYIKRKAEPGDADRYQTIYAVNDGSVAAPTAGLHFTNAVFEKLKEKNIETCYVTLHVGAGTFKPVKAAIMEDHEMHAEFIDVSIQSIQQIMSAERNTLVAVGTTSLRTIETLYWLGVKILISKSSTDSFIPELSQWEAYELEKQKILPADALSALLNWMTNNKLERLITKTQLIIAPGYKIKLAKALVTNFHQPGSTLLLLVAAIIGDGWKRVYEYALENEFRFLSYGDGSLLWINAEDNDIKSSLKETQQ